MHRLASGEGDGLAVILDPASGVGCRRAPLNRFRAWDRTTRADLAALLGTVGSIAQRWRAAKLTNRVTMVKGTTKLNMMLL